MDDRLKAFLDELAALTLKHGFEIGGCGECGSPYVVDLTAGESAQSVLDHLTWAEKSKRYAANSDVVDGVAYGSKEEREAAMNALHAETLKQIARNEAEAQRKSRKD